ncbi:hypothetical protein FF38_07172 [Lucilia cuprina]|uniref:Uncharacterized protein n=1 Tax=Lucilia cuprina TaxID=7375 RepID=A0A0L0BSZ2_LUCCU|nr:Ras-like GTP-binding protein RhoL [Lucilia cuprina]KNC23103.1 hypothetical protein FF38_07172 [Lucilia cuprina]
MKELKFLLIGDTSLNTSNLLDTYLWQLHFGYAYHDHIVQHRRYRITLYEISSIEEFQQILPVDNSEVICICLLCFNIMQRRTFESIKYKWLRPVLDSSAKVFLVALQNNLKARLLTKLTPNNGNIKSIEILNLCRNYDGRVGYLKCLNFDKKNVGKLFDKAIKKVLYSN